jgi:hypothetical protein
MPNTTTTTNNNFLPRRSSPSSISSRICLTFIGLILTTITLKLAFDTYQFTTRPGGISFFIQYWMITTSHLMGFGQALPADINTLFYQNNQPPPTHIAPPIIQPLPEISHTQFNSKFTSIFPSTPVVIRGLAQSDSSHFSIPSIPEIIDAYKNASIPVFLQDDQIAYVSFDDYVYRLMPDHTSTAYARCIRLYGGLEKSLNSEYVAQTMGLGYMLNIPFTENFDLRCMFFGNAKARSNTHCDGLSTTVVEVAGRKVWRFVSPKDSPYMYTHVKHPLNFIISSRVNLFEPDLQQHPLAQHITMYETILEPGDVLFFPSFWWHSVQNLDTITASFILPVMDLPGSASRNLPLLLSFALNWKVWYAQATSGLYEVMYENYELRCKGEGGSCVI